MPGSYTCPKGGRHQWETRQQGGMTIRVCVKCGEKRPA